MRLWKLELLSQIKGLLSLRASRSNQVILVPVLKTDSSGQGKTSECSEVKLQLHKKNFLNLLTEAHAGWVD